MLIGFTGLAPAPLPAVQIHRLITDAWIADTPPQQVEAIRRLGQSDEGKLLAKHDLFHLSIRDPQAPVRDAALEVLRETRSYARRDAR